MWERRQVNGTATPHARETSATVPGRTTRIAKLASSPAQPTPTTTGSVRSQASGSFTVTATFARDDMGHAQDDGARRSDRPP